MREIKFRAWDKVNKRMIDFSHRKSGLLFSGDEHFFSTGWNGYKEPVFNEDNKTDYHLMQYTGIKNYGVEIYEGDIVIKDGKPREVIFSEKAAKFCVRKPSKQWYGVVSKVYSLIGCEVIGNIYENPELLEDKE